MTNLDFSSRRSGRCWSRSATPATRPRPRSCEGGCGSTRGRACWPGAIGPGGRAGQARREPAARRPAARRAGDAPQGQAARRRDRRLRALGHDGRARPARPGRGRPPAAGRASTSRPGGQFWAYRPPRRHAAPGRRATPAGRRPTSTASSSPGWRPRGCSPVADADRATLVRRLSFDLIGLPPTPEEVDAFVADPSPDAYEALVDRLLASPRFGERWGRHWLDVARFGESLTLRGLVFKDAWRYRDYVIDAFNADMPFDRFVREQIAGDLLPADTPGRPPPAAGRHHVPGRSATPTSRSRTRRSSRMDVVDEQLDTIGKAFLGQTIGCARCHDHKFDPIPTRDYYALAGILRNTRTLEHANVSKWIEVAAARRARTRGGGPAARRRPSPRCEARIKAERRRRGRTAGAGQGALAAGELPGVVVDDAQARKVGDWKASTLLGHLHRRRLRPRRRTRPRGRRRSPSSPSSPRPASTRSGSPTRPAPNRADGRPGDRLQRRRREDRRRSTCGPSPADRRPVRLARAGTGSRRTARATSWSRTRGRRASSPPTPSSSSRRRPLRDRPPAAAGARGRARSAALEAELKRLKATAPKRDLAMSVVEEAEDRRHPGPRPRQRPHPRRDRPRAGSCGWRPTAPPPAIPRDESGRRELADWLAARGQPADGPRLRQPRLALALRRGPRPHHRQLRHDRRAARRTPNCSTTWPSGSCEDGWSVKTLVRRIVLSRAYRLSTADDPEARRGRPREPPALADEPPPARRRVHPRRDAVASAAGSDPTWAGPTFPADLAADYGYDARRHPAERLPAGLPQRPARAVRGVRLRRPEHGRRPPERQHRGPAGALPDEPPVRPRPGPARRPAGCWPKPGPDDDGPGRPRLPPDPRPRRRPTPSDGSRSASLGRERAPPRRRGGVGGRLPGAVRVDRLPVRELRPTRRPGPRAEERRRDPPDQPPRGL